MYMKNYVYINITILVNIIILGLNNGSIFETIFTNFIKSLRSDLHYTNGPTKLFKKKKKTLLNFFQLSFKGIDLKLNYFDSYELNSNF